LEFEVNADRLLDDLKIIKNFIGTSKSSPDITKGIYIIADDELIIEASDFRHGCRIIVEDAEIFRGGECVIEGTKFINLISTLSNRIKISEKRGSVDISQINAKRPQKFTMQAYIDGPDNFPIMPSPGKNAKKTIADPDILKRELNLVKFAAEKVNTVFSGDDINDIAQMIVFDRGLIYATNQQKIAVHKNPSINLEILHYPKTAISFLNNFENNVSIEIENDLFFMTDGRIFVMIKTPIVDNLSHRVKSIHEDDPIEEVVYYMDEAEVNMFVHSLKQLNIFSESTAIKFNKQNIWIASTNSDSPHRTIQSIPVEAIEFQQPMYGVFSIDYLLQSLRAIGEGKLYIPKTKQQPLKMDNEEVSVYIAQMVGNFEDMLDQRIREVTK